MTVRECQEWLCLNGHLVKVDGIMGPATQAALRRFQEGTWLDPTGQIDAQTAAFLMRPLTEATNLGGMKAATFGEAVLKVAKHYLSFHPREVGGQNMGPWVRHFMRGNEGPDFPWCCGGVCTVLKRAATVRGEMKIKYTMSCDVLAQQAQTLGVFVKGEDRSDLNEGVAIFLLRGKQSGDWVHAGIAVLKGDHFETYEMNSNDEGSREGHEMCARIRAYRGVDFVRL